MSGSPSLHVCAPQKNLIETDDDEVYLGPPPEIKIDFSATTTPAAPARPMHKGRFVSAPPAGAMAHPGRQQQKQQQQAQHQPRRKMVRLRQLHQVEAMPSLNDVVRSGARSGPVRDACWAALTHGAPLCPG